MKKQIILLSLVLIGASIIQAQNTVNFKVGLFIPSMRSDIWDFNVTNLDFSKNDMVGLYYAVEYEYFLSRYVSFTFESGNYSQTIHTQYRDYVDNNNNPIYQSVKLSITPLEINFKFYPAGYRHKVTPFLGAGGGLYFWRYESWGDFIDFSTNEILTDREAISDKISFGFNARAGFLVHFTRDLAFIAEGKYQYLKDSLSSDFAGFENIDLSGFYGVAGFSYRF